MGETSLRITIPLAAAVLGFIFSYFLQKLKERKEPRHRLTWVATTQTGVIQTIPDLQEDIHVTYKGASVKELVAVTCSIKNTGNRVVKNHVLRFEFPTGSNTLDATLDPEPQRELGVTRKHSLESGPNEVVFEIGHLEKGQEVIVKLLTSGNRAADWKIHSFNEAGDVEFYQRDISKNKDDSEHVVPFFQLSVILLLALVFTIPIQQYTLVREVTFLTEATVSVLLARHVTPVARIIRARLWTRSASPEEKTVPIHIFGDIEHLEIKNHASQSKAETTGAKTVPDA